MKKFVLFTLVLVLAVAFAFAALQAPTAGSALAEAPQTVSYVIKPPPPITPCVGWNT